MMLICVSSLLGYVPILCCAPSIKVAECLDCILQAMLKVKRDDSDWRIDNVAS